jgi:hypothetical protein
MMIFAMAPSSGSNAENIAAAGPQGPGRLVVASHRTSPSGRKPDPGFGQSVRILTMPCHANRRL